MKMQTNNEASLEHCLTRSWICEMQTPSLAEEAARLEANMLTYAADLLCVMHQQAGKKVSIIHDTFSNRVHLSFSLHSIG